MHRKFSQAQKALLNFLLCQWTLFIIYNISILYYLLTETMRKKYRNYAPESIEMNSTIMPPDTKISSFKESRSKPRQKTNNLSRNSSNAIQQIYGKVNRFRTLRRQKQERQSTSKTKDLLKVSLNNAKIENSFNNIIINFSERNNPKGSLLSSLNARPDQTKLVMERKARSKEIQRSIEGRKYARSKVLSQRGQQVSSSSLVMKDKVNYNHDKQRGSIKSSYNKNRKHESQTLNDEARKSQPKLKKSKISQLEGVLNNFVQSFQCIINQPISLETYQTKQMKMQRKMKQTACSILRRVINRKLRSAFLSLN